MLPMPVTAGRHDERDGFGGSGMAEEERDQHVEALIEAARVTHAERIPPEAEQRFRDSVAGLRAAVRELNAYPLTNADEPGILFAAYRREG